MKAYLRLIHWRAVEAEERARQISSLGYRVFTEAPAGAAFLKELQQCPPAAIIIDLSRLPAQGRDLALMVRHSKATRQIQIIFVDGESEKVARIKELLPDAVYTTWGEIDRILPQTLKHPPKNPLVPSSVFQ